MHCYIAASRLEDEMAETFVALCKIVLVLIGTMSTLIVGASLTSQESAEQLFCEHLIGQDRILERSSEDE